MLLGKKKKKNFYDQSQNAYDLSVIKGKSILLFSSIANPKVFYQTVERLEPLSIKDIMFMDHHIYSTEEIEEIISESKDYDYVITTEKDIVKINNKIDNLLVLKMEFTIQ